MLVYPFLPSCEPVRQEPINTSSDVLPDWPHSGLDDQFTSSSTQTWQPWTHWTGIAILRRLCFYILFQYVSLFTHYVLYIYIYIIFVYLSRYIKSGNVFKNSPQISTLKSQSPWNIFTWKTTTSLSYMLLMTLIVMSYHVADGVGCHFINSLIRMIFRGYPTYSVKWNEQLSSNSFVSYNPECVLSGVISLSIPGVRQLKFIRSPSLCSRVFLGEQAMRCYFIILTLVLWRFYEFTTE